MKLLVKLPTRSRPEKFFEVMDLYYNYVESIDNVLFIVSCDTDDTTMNNHNVISRISNYKNTKVYFSQNKSKIQAVNANVPSEGWDVLLLASDDMIPQKRGYDKIITENMTKHYPDTDGVLWFPDGYRSDLNTLSIMGKKYYDRFGYIYHPAYYSLWCDNEFQEVAEKLGKQTKVDDVIIKHCHVEFGHGKRDNLYFRNNTLEPDMRVFQQRKALGFPK